MKHQIIRLNQTIPMLATVLALAAAQPARANGDPANPGILPPHSELYGESYGQWAADWWTWALSIPAEINPLNDTNGAFAAVGQHGPVWFLAGATSGAATRNVTVPEGKALFFPIINTLWWTAPTDPPTSLADILAALAGVTADITNLSCAIDGVAVKHLEKDVTISPVFSLTIPADNVLGLPAAVYTPDIDEGVYLMLAPLRPGTHTIHFTGSSPDLGYSLDVTYNLTVQPPPHHGPGPDGH
jgi:hypothetical protein